MSETNPPVPNDPPPAVGYAPPDPAAGRPVLVRLGGALGVAACIVGLAVMVFACAGMGAALKMAFIPALLGGVGFVLSVVGGVVERTKLAEDTHVLAALFASTMGVIGGLVEMAAGHGWKLFSV